MAEAPQTITEMEDEAPHAVRPAAALMRPDDNPLAGVGDER